MKQKYTINLKIILLLILTSGNYGCRKEAVSEFLNPTEIQGENWEIIPGKYIVVFEKRELKKNSRLPSTLKYSERQNIILADAEKIIREKNIRNSKIGNIYSEVVVGFSAELDKEDVEILRKDPKVAYVENDRYVVLKRPPGVGKDKGNNIPAGETVPWGINRVGYGNGTNTGRKAWIIDTGIDLDHPDLNVDNNLSISFLSRNESTPEDKNGHGTHVAGTIGAIDNEIGVIGVAAGATVVAVKVLNKNGSGYLSDVLEGIDYVAGNAKAGDVANLSLSGSANNLFDAAVIAAADKGIFFSIAAGNNRFNASNISPARVEHENVFTVSAMDSNNEWASFSNYGNPPIDYCAPGVSVMSCWKGGGYNTISGTSMAAPHVGGLLLLNGKDIGKDGYVGSDPDGSPDPIAHIDEEINTISGTSIAAQ